MSCPLSQRPLDIIFYQGSVPQPISKVVQSPSSVGMRDRRERNRWTERGRDRRETGTDRDSQRRREGDRPERGETETDREGERDSACTTRAELIPTRAVPIIARAWLRH